MADAGLAEVVLRVVVSLGLVLALIGVAFAIAKRKTGRGITPSRRSRRGTPPAIEVIGRAGLARGASAVALRFGDRVVMVGVTEQAPTTVLAEITTEDWDELQRIDDEPVVDTTPLPFGKDGVSNGPVGPRPTFLEALRHATSRRA